MPSMVVTFLPSTAATGSTHERVATPSTCTVQAPHWATPQPYLVPVRPACSRSVQSSGVLGSTSIAVFLPLRMKRAIACLLYIGCVWLNDSRPRLIRGGAVLFFYAAVQRYSALIPD